MNKYAKAAWNCFLISVLVFTLFILALVSAEDLAVKGTGTEKSAGSVNTIPSAATSYSCLSSVCREIDRVWASISPLIGSKYAGKLWDTQKGWVKEIPDYVPAPVTSAGATDLRGPPTISVQLIDAVLEKAGSPAAGTGKYFVQYGLEYGIDPAFALAFFRRESTYGKYGVAGKCKGIGNIVYTSTALPDFKCVSSNDREWSGYYNYENSIKGWYHYMVNSQHYFKAGKYTLEEIIPIYAPETENDVQAYISSVKAHLKEYRETEMALA